MESHSQKHHEQSNKNWYDRNYKLMMLVPAALFIFSLVYLVIFYQNNGDIFQKDVTLTGGTTVTVYDQNANIKDVETALKSKYPDVVTRGISDIRTGRQEGFFIETKSTQEEIIPEIEKILGYKLNSDNSSVEFSGSSLSQGFYKQLQIAIIIAFVLMGIVVFILFRNPIRSWSIILALISDIIMTIAVIDIFQVRISASGIVALLMLIGYSVDVDILLTTRVFKDHEGTLNHRIFGAFKTGMTMTLTAIASVGVALIFTFSFSSVLAQMFTILLIGLGFDMLNCWVTNASILKWYAEAKHIS